MDGIEKSDSFAVLYICCIVEFSAFLTVIAMNASMDLIYLLTSCCLMKSVNILRNDCFKFSCLLKFCQLFMRGIRLRI